MKWMVVILVAAISTGAYAQDPVRIEPVDGQGAIVAVDVLSPPSRTAEFVRNHWGKILTAAAAAVTLDRVAENNGWLWYESNKRKDEGQRAGRDVSNASTQSVLVVDVSGSQNTVTIVNQQPQGSQPAANANSGSGGVTAL